MNPEYDKYELIDRYLQNQLEGEELRLFEKRVSEDQEFAEIVEAQKLANELIFDEQLLALKDRIKADLDNNGSNFDPGRTIILFLLIIAIVSSIYYFSTDYFNTPIEVNSNRGIIDTLNTSHKNTPVFNQKDEIIKEEKSDTVISKKLVINKATKEEALIKDYTLQEDAVLQIKNNEETPLLVKPLADIMEVTEVNELKNNNNDSQKLTDQCANVRITASVKTESTCKNKSKGKLIIVKSSVKGGEKPYLFAINNQEYSDTYQFNNLPSGEYSIRIKDQNNCVSLLDEIFTISSKACYELINESFIPSNGETWKFPMNEYSDGNVLIVNKAGRKVYSTIISGGYPDSWDGRNNEGGQVEVGYYQFIITYPNGEQQSGYITILN